jgi:transposase
MTMGPRFKNLDRDTPLLLPPNLRDWLPDDHLVHFILDAVETLDLRGFRVNERGTGDEQFPPSVMLALLIYCYATGTFSSRRIEQATYDSVPVRVLTADTHPDHDTVCTFRRQNKVLFTECFVKVLQLAHELKVAKFGQVTVAADGTKVLANASKHSAVSYERAGQMIAQLELEVQQLVAKAEAADTTPLDDGLKIPDEIVRRRERQAQLAKARAELEARAHARYAAQLAEHEEKMAARQARQDRGEKVRGPGPKAPTPEPQPRDQYNFTDPQSRIMKAGTGEHFEQAYNAQAAVTVDSRLIVGERVTPAPNDKEQLVPDVAAIPAAVTDVAAVLVDNGFFSEAAVRAVEQTAASPPSGTLVYAAVAKTSHHRSVTDLEKKDDPEPPPAGASLTEVMRHRLQTKAGKALYKLRQQTVEPVFGIIKSVLGFRQFRLRGLAKVSLEWTLVCLAYNFRRLHRLGLGDKLAAAG